MPNRFSVSDKPTSNPTHTASPWVVNGYREDGKRVRLYFATKFQAQQEANKLNAEANRTGLLGNLTDPQRVEAERCFAKLAESGATLTEAVDSFLARRDELERSVTVSEAYAHMMETKEGEGAGRLYLTQLRNMLKDFVKKHGRRKMDDITTRDLDAFITAQRQDDGSAFSPKSRNNLRGYLATLWNHAVKKGLAKDNPAKATVKAAEPGRDVAILSPAAMREAIAVAREICAESVTPLVIQAFAGLRSAEVAKLDWSDINLEDGHITVSAGKSKTRTRRNVPISANLLAFLAPIAKEEGKVTSACHRIEFPKIRAAVVAKGHSWGDNALRHSFVSYRLTETGNENMTALEAGHTLQMLHEHYKGLTSKKAAAAWWAIVP